jgi:hypothetical protein
MIAYVYAEASPKLHSTLNTMKQTGTLWSAQCSPGPLTLILSDALYASERIKLTEFSAVLAVAIDGIKYMR